MPLGDFIRKFFKSEHGNIVVKRKAREPHFCSQGGEEIEINSEYYNINYKIDYGSWGSMKICDLCWHGEPLSAKNKKRYKDIDLSEYLKPVSLD